MEFILYIHIINYEIKIKYPLAKIIELYKYILYSNRESLYIDETLFKRLVYYSDNDWDGAQYGRLEKKISRVRIKKKVLNVRFSAFILFRFYLIQTNDI